MANILERFNKLAVGSNNSISDQIAIISPAGDFSRINNVEVVLASWNNILQTPEGTYTFDPEYGTKLYKMIFEPADEDTIKIIKDEIEHKLMRYDDRATITDIEVNFLNNQKGFFVNVYLKYDGDLSKLEVIIDESVYFQFMRSG